MANIKAGFGVVRSRGLFATEPDVLSVQEGIFHQAEEGEVDPIDQTKLEAGVWYLQAPYPQSLLAVDRLDLIHCDRVAAEKARQAYGRKMLAETHQEIERLARRAAALVANLTPFHFGS